jgi:PAS domain S-box-containing protein
MTETDATASDNVCGADLQPQNPELARLKEVLRHAPMVLMAIDSAGGFSLVDGGALPYWQAGGRPMVGASMYDLLESSPELVDGFEKALGGQSQRCRTYVGDRIFELSFSPAGSETGTTVRACCVAKDITERAESEKQRIEEQLASFEQQRRMAADFRAVIERLPLGIVVTRDQRIVFFNLSAATCLRWADPDSYLGRDFSQCFPPESRASLIEKQSELLELVRFGEVQLATGDGKGIVAEVQSVGIEFEGTRASLFAIRDVTDVHRMEQDLRQAQRLEAIGRLAAGIAHEINTPIQFIGDNASFLGRAFVDVSAYLSLCEVEIPAGEARAGLVARKDELDVVFAQEQAPQAAANIAEGVERVAKIVSAMKAYAHPGDAKKSPADINRALETTVVVATNEWKQVAKVVTQLGEIPPVPCRLGELNQVFLNLLVNASHAIGERVSGEDKGQITIRTFVENDMVVVAIGDNGTGIPTDVRDRVFDPFFTTKGVGRGTGQGLTLARRVVVDQHGGQLDFATEVGKGTTFFVRLPLRASEDTAAA